MVEAAGGKQVAYYYAPKDSVAYTITEFDDEANGDTILLTALAGEGIAPGALRVSRILTGAELADAARRAGGIGYSLRSAAGSRPRVAKAMSTGRAS